MNVISSKTVTADKSKPVYDINKARVLSTIQKELNHIIKMMSGSDENPPIALQTIKNTG